MPKRFLLDMKGGVLVFCKFVREISDIWLWRFVLILVWGRRESVAWCWCLRIVVELVWELWLAMAGRLVVVGFEWKEVLWRFAEKMKTSPNTNTDTVHASCADIALTSALSHHHMDSILTHLYLHTHTHLPFHLHLHLHLHTHTLAHTQIHTYIHTHTHGPTKTHKQTHK